MSSMSEQIGNLNRKLKLQKESWVETAKLKSAITKTKKNLLDKLNRRLEMTEKKSVNVKEDK